MSHKAAKIGVTSLVLLTAFGVLLYTTLGESMQYYKYVDEVVGSQADWSGKKMQVHGYVVPGSRMKNPDTLEWKFKVQNNPVRSNEPGRIVDAYYNQFVRSLWQGLTVLTEPVLRPIRRVLPNFGGVDIAPVVLLVALAVLREALRYYVWPMIA